MRIGIDMRMAGGGAGISRYIEQLAFNILSKDKSNEYVLFFNEIPEPLKEKFCSFGCEMVETGIVHYSIGEQLELPRVLNSKKLDIVHFPHFNVPLFYRGPFVVTIHDLTHTKFPGRKKSHFFHRLAYRLILRRALLRAKQIIAVSESTKREVLGHFKSLSPEKVSVIYEGAASEYKLVDRSEAKAKISHYFQISKPYILYVGVWRRYKNLPVLAGAFDKVCERFDCDLVLAGEEDPHYPEIKKRIMGIKNSRRVRALGRVSDEHLNLLYNGCSLFVLPSLYEGFGLTVLEASACGAPVACSDIPALREVMGGSAEFFDPENEQNMADVISSVLENPNKAEELANAGLRRVNHFSWSKAASDTINIYMS
jgi:glycosyltransferase involved in cell wall biosynthesis